MTHKFLFTLVFAATSAMASLSWAQVERPDETGAGGTSQGNRRQPGSVQPGIGGPIPNPRAANANAGAAQFGAPPAFQSNQSPATNSPPIVESSPLNYAPSDNSGSFSSTAEEGLSRGVSSLIRSAGEANLLNSEAAKRYEEARARMLDNRLKAAATYYDMRYQNKLQRFAGEGLTEEQLFRINHSRLPARLTPAEVDPVSGQIDWPVLLREDRFAAERGVVEEAFATRATYGAFASSDQYLQLRNTLGRMKELLGEHIEQAPTGDYNAARNFLSSLEYEAHLTVQ